MNLVIEKNLSTEEGIPRVSGGEPILKALHINFHMYSPRERG